MHSDKVQDRLVWILKNAKFELEDCEDGMYRFMIILKIDSRQDLITIKQLRFNKFMGFADPLTGKQISEEQAFGVLAPSRWQKYKTKLFSCWDFCFRIAVTALLGAIFYGWIYR